MPSTARLPKRTLSNARRHLLLGEDAEARLIIAEIVQSGTDSQRAEAMLEILDKRALAAWRIALRAGDNTRVVEAGTVLLELDLFDNEWMAEFVRAGLKVGLPIQMVKAVAIRALSSAQEEATYLNLFELLKKEASAEAAIEFGFTALRLIGASPTFLEKLTLEVERIQGHSL